MLRILRRFSGSPFVRYHYDKDVYGFRSPRNAPSVTYSDEELLNRNTHANLLRFVLAFREHGHKAADLDPLNLTPSNHVPELNPQLYGLSENDGQKYPLSGIVHLGKSTDPSIPKAQATLKQVHDHLKRVYSNRVAFEIEHVSNDAEKRWLAQYIESYEWKTPSNEQKLRMMNLITKSETFDHFMAKKFPQVKRYGLEGAESMMIALDSLFANAAQANMRDIVLAMPHRGRLNLLTGLLQFDSTRLFHKVKGNTEFPASVPGLGDVLSHLATSVDLDYGSARPLHVSLLHNPSHLEAVNPVAMGKARARQMYLYDLGTEQDCYLGDRVMCVQLHGDAAFTGQGVVTESLGLSNLPHFTSGGSVHLIVNNQIGYTTPAMNARSTVYTSDVAKMICAPIIHVNADYPEEVAHAMHFAFEYRNKFRKDVIVDLIAYRRWGHNELDEPAFTQPTMYKNIRGRKSVPVLYEEKLKQESVVTQETIDSVRKNYFEELDGHLKASYSYQTELDSLKGKWSKMTVCMEPDLSPLTGVPIDTLKAIGIQSVQTPEKFTPHPRLQKHHIEHRLKRLEEGTSLDWATAEALAFGSLLKEGCHVRISGQDVGRGTFSQRHVMLVDQETERTIIPLNHLNVPKQAKLEIANSSLSEFAVLGFEVGISWETPNRLCIWEAQFGDFFNGAQIIIDTYLSSGEAKWFRQSGLVMLLPHGYDGAGPEHSSSHIERFLQLTDAPFDVLSEQKQPPNMHVVFPTTPAQYFHLLSRQIIRPYRKPLIVIGPKILLRHPLAISSLSEMETGTHFFPVIPDTTIQHPEKVQRVLFVAGKFYYELYTQRAAKNLDEKVALVRIEELSPFPAAEIKEAIAGYTQANDFVYVQEEPQNQGAYTFMEPRLNQIVPSKIRYVGRATCAAPATGVSAHHKAELSKLLKEAFEGL